MSYDLIGPSNAPNSVTTRPADSRSTNGAVVGAADTWFQDCTSPAANDGTKVMAAWLNGIMGQLRNAIRGNGNLLSSSTPVVVENDTDDSMLWKAIQYLFQRNKPKYAQDISNLANTITVTLSPSPAEYTEGMMVIAKINNNSTGGGAVINVNGLGAKTILHSDGSAIGLNDLQRSAIQALVYDGTNFQLAWSQRQPGAPIYLQTNLDYYVGGSGANDSNDGLADHVTGGHGPWASLQHAQDYIAQFNLNGHNIGVHVADSGGTPYGPLSLAGMSGGGNVNWTGNPTTPGNCQIAGTSKSGISGGYCGQAHTFNGFGVSCSGAYAGDPMIGVHVFGSGTKVQVSNMSYGACPGGHYSAEQGATLVITGAEIVTGGCAGSVGGNGAHANVATNGQIQTPAPIPLTITTAVNFAAGWVVASNLGFLQILYSSQSGAGAVTGQRYNVGNGAWISTNGGGANYYPGNVAGVGSNYN